MEEDRQTTNAGSASSSVASDTEKVRLSFSVRDRDDDEQQQPRVTRLLRIPHGDLITLSTKPRKWLCYAAYAICGATGTLQDTENRLVGLEGDVDPGDHFIYHLDAAPEFVDWNARGRTHSQHSVLSQLTAVGLLRGYYGGCPFTKVPEIHCQCCHLIPHVKTDEYLQAVLRARRDPDERMGIDDPRNMIMLDPRLHTFFDNLTMAFLRTPNGFLQSNEIPGRETEDPEKYLITLHAFSQEILPLASHGVSSDMMEDSGKWQPREDRQINRNVLHNDTILDIAYAAALLAQWGSKRLKPLLDENAKKYYPGGEIKRGEDRQGKTRREEERRRRDRQNRERDERAARRNASATGGATGHTANRQLSEREEEIRDILLWMPYISRGISPAMVLAKREEQRKKVEREEAERIVEWQNRIPEESASDVEELECPNPVPDTDEEKAVSIEEALSRIPQGPFTCLSPIPSLSPVTRSSASDPDESMASASETNEGCKAPIMAGHDEPVWGLPMHVDGHQDFAAERDRRKGIDSPVECSNEMLSTCA